MLADIKLVLFDMAGTTVHDDHYVTNALCEALALHGYSVPQTAADDVMGISKPVAIGMLLKRFYPELGTQAPISLIHEEFLKLMSRFYTSAPEIREINGTSAVFRLLKEQGIKVGIDTGFSRDITNIIIDRLGWQEQGLLDVTVASDEVAQGRPSPDMVFRAMDLVGITDVKTVMKVGDTPVDIMEGINAGCGAVVGVLSGVGTREELGRYDGVVLVASIRDVLGLITENAPA
ncbi:MAG: HAD hydrolase-like protein [Taibaiella sp.]|jgi:phosphonatase-like hydrolase